MQTPSDDGLAWSQVFELRAQLYAFFGNSFCRVMAQGQADCLDPAFWQAFPLEAANEHMERGLSALDQVTGGLRAMPVEDAVRQVAVEYTRLFVGPGTPLAPLWESLYREGGTYLFGQPTFDMRELFRSYGLKLDAGVRHLEDHLGVQLLFLAAMSSRFAAQQPSAQDVASQRSFLHDHLLWWMGDLLAKAHDHATVGYYSALVELVWGVLEWDADLLGEYAM